MSKNITGALRAHDRTNVHVYTQKSPAHTQKSPTYNVKRALYIMSNGPYIQVHCAHMIAPTCT